MQVLGLCRFSYPAIGGFQVEHASPAERAAFLYEPARMDERFRIFEAFTLPALRGQSDPDFTLLVVVGDDLPAVHLERLRALIAGLPQAQIVPRAPGVHRKVMQQVINAARRDDGQPCIQFRMDDDDAVSLRFVESLRQVAADVRPLIDRNRTTAIDFTRGHIARPSAQGIWAERVTRGYWAPGMAVVSAPRDPLTVMNFNHARVWHLMPTITLNTPDMFVRGICAQNDSSLVGGADMELLDPEGEARFSAAYGIDAGRVRALYRGPA